MYEKISTRKGARCHNRTGSGQVYMRKSTREVFDICDRSLFIFPIPFTCFLVEFEFVDLRVLWAIHYHIFPRKIQMDRWKNGGQQIDNSPAGVRRPEKSAMNTNRRRAETFSTKKNSAQSE